MKFLRIIYIDEKRDIFIRLEKIEIISFEDSILKIYTTTYNKPILFSNEDLCSAIALLICSEGNLIADCLSPYRIIGSFLVFKIDNVVIELHV